MYSRFEALGVFAKVLDSLNSSAIQQIDCEMNEETLLVTTIKNQTADKKAQRDFQEQMDDFDSRPRTPTGKLKIKKDIFRNTTQGFGNFRSGALSNRSGNSSMERSSARERDPMRESTMYFLKSAFGKNTDNQSDNFYKSTKRSNSREELDNSSGGSTTGMSMLKARRSTNKKLKFKKENKTPFEVSESRGRESMMSIDIKSMIDTFGKQGSEFKDQMNSHRSQSRDFS